MNVYPVPDGDTGTNMLLTLRATLEEAARLDPEGRDIPVGELMEALARGALMGARGNSGVILSQMVRGLARAAAGATQLDAPTLAAGLEEAARLAYQAVANPKEGTMLTVARETAAAVRSLVDDGEKDLVTLFTAAAHKARETVDRTPEMLPVLAEAGVVDAGGQGLWVLLDSFARCLRGESLEEAPALAPAHVQRDWLSHTQEMHAAEPSLYGYCTQFLVEGQGLEPETIRARLEQLGDSVVAVGDERLVRAHVHTNDPGGAIRIGTDVGELLEVRIENIRQQAGQFFQLQESLQPTAAVVAVAPGDGLAQTLRSLGAIVVSGGPTMNPSAGQLLDAIESAPAQEVILLPNDKNILLAARQAAEMSSKKVAVLETVSVPQGIAAVLAFGPSRDLEDNVQAMQEAAAAVRTIEVTRSVRDVRIGDLEVREGDYIALVDGELKVKAASAEEALHRALDLLDGSEGLLTLYYGAEVTAQEAEALAQELGRERPGLEVEVVYGGQPHYPYLASLE
ncbi:MAG: DAK2 domain-containing protein [Dehalococcoidia bacterium]|nr:DAK2 domain-containing protein [Dehalococcoidia bacterium]